MKNLHFDNSYKIWSTFDMKSEIIHKCHILYDSMDADKILNRSYKGMYIEWYLHNIGYYITLPFVNNEYIKSLNNRFKDLDLEELNIDDM